MSRLRALWRSLYVRRRWLTIGIGVKRWLVLLVAGAAVTSIGWVYLLLAFNREGWLPGLLYDALTLRFLPLGLRVALPLLVGGLIILVAVVRLGKSLVEPLRGSEGAVVDSLYDYRRRDRGPHIVAIGGGTGLPGLLRGLTPFTSNITAIVTVADDGGSSGRLRREMGLLPPGDFRNNLAALARDEALMTQVLQYRFGEQIPGVRGQVPGEEPSSLEPRTWPLAPSSLSGHAFGNLLLAALTGITGSFDEALLAAQRVLALRGQVLPSTLDNVTLVGEVVMPDGETRHVAGESAIPKAGGRVQQVRLEPPDAPPYPPTLRAIFGADLIVLGPGSLYTSILPNLLLRDLAEALIHARAPVVYVCNLATQPGETDGYSVADHVAALQRHLPPGCIDLVLANDNLSVPPGTGGGQTQYVLPTPPTSVPLIAVDLVDEARPWRHDSEKLGRAVMSLLMQGTGEAGVKREVRRTSESATHHD
jgi:uncharacterized cofD-like protein